MQRMVTGFRSHTFTVIRGGFTCVLTHPCKFKASVVKLEISAGMFIYLTDANKQVSNMLQNKLQIKVAQ